MKVDKALIVFAWHEFQGPDWCLVVILLIIMACVTTLVKPHCRSFEWTDASIGYPMKPDTFPNWSVALLVLIPFAIFIVGTLWVVGWLQKHLPEPLTVFIAARFTRRAQPAADGEVSGPADGQAIYGYETRQMTIGRGPLYGWIRAHMWTLTSQLFIMALTKSYAGRLRPDYIDRLRQAGYVANDTSLPDPTTNPEFYCQLMDDHPALKEGRFSFPSGHSSTAFASCVIVCFYLIAHLRPFARQGSFVRLFIALSPLWVAFICAISRTRDNKHHFSDILAGTLLGTVCAMVCFAMCFREISGIAGPLNIYVERTENDVEYVEWQRASQQKKNEGPRTKELDTTSGRYDPANTTTVVIEDERALGAGDSANAPLPLYPTSQLSERQLNQNQRTVPWL